MTDLVALARRLGPERLAQVAAGWSEKERVALDSALTDAVVAGGWPPDPAQMPPTDDDWYFWLLMGGRGTGKTRTAAKAMLDHARSPACIDTVRGGHRMVLLAPTQGDAARSVIDGPSGLRAQDPRVRYGAGHGGTTVVFPNQSYALVVGSHGPDDVERLRAAGNSCLAGDTLVVTDRGDRRIEEIRPGDRVLTREGWRRVRAAWCSGVAETIRVETDRGSYRVTADHRTWTADGWCEAGAIPVGTMLPTWASNGQSGAAGRGTEARTGTSDGRIPASSTAPSMPTSTARSPRGSSSTTATGTRATTGSRTSNYSHTPSTSSGTRGAVSGTSPGGARRQRGDLAGQPSASGAGASVSTAHGAAHDGGAPLRADVPPGGKRPRSSSGYALSAGPSSRSGFRSRRPRPALVRVRRVSPGAVAEPVYDLAVDGCHEFVLAAGPTLHNCFAVWDEVAASRRLTECYDQLRLGLRLGPRPRLVGATTPKARKEFRKLVALPSTRLSRLSTYDAWWLEPGVVEAFRDQYGGTRNERQELLGELLDDIEGALWTEALLDLGRVETAPAMRRVVVAVDPSGGDAENNSEQGIVVAGLGVDGDGYVLDDRTCKLSPDGWGRRAFQAAIDYAADTIVVESNFGGKMAVHTLQIAKQGMLAEGETVAGIRIVEVNAVQGKRLRAEPVHALYEQGRVHHVGRLPGLEGQMCEWVPEDGQRSPDRLDALVHSVTHLLVSPPRRGGLRFYPAA